MRRINSIIVRLLLLLFLFHGAALMYLESLEGGTVGWIHANLFRLTVLLISSAVGTAMAVMLTLSSPFPRMLKIAFLAYGVSVMSILILSDQGDTEIKHGGYNGICFLFLEVVFGLLGGVAWFSWKGLGTTKWVALWSVVGVYLLYVSRGRLLKGKEVWHLGVGGGQLDNFVEGGGEGRIVGRNFERHGCTIEYPDWPWEDLLPPRTLTFWTGSQECPAEPQFSDWVDEGAGKIRFECPSGVPAAYQLLPRTENYIWGDPRYFEGVQDFQKHVLGASEIVTLTSSMDKGEGVDRNQPIEVGKKAEAVLATCGAHSNLLIRNVRNERAVDRVLKHSLWVNKQKKAIGDPLPAQTMKVLKNLPLDNRPKVNVLLLYMDALSRRHFHRRFPQTVSFLESLKKKEGAGKEEGSTTELFEFFRYHAIGITTSRNARAMFTGFSLRPYLKFNLLKFNQQRFKKKGDGIGEVGYKKGAGYPTPIWLRYQQQGYLTAQIDNSCQDWEAKYLAHSSMGWDHQFVAPFCLPEYFPINNPHGNWVGPFAIRRRCLAGQQVHKWVLNYTDKLWRNYADVPKFAISAFTEGHEGTSEVVGLLDKDIAHILSNSSLSLNDTIVFLLSDHGLHMGLYFGLQAESALRENALPLWIGLFPKWYLDQLGEDVRNNLRHNQQSLLSAYDIYATLNDILGFPEEKLQPHARSIFEYVPYNRTCDDTLIPQDRCQCS